jgi:hypothetical protein
VLQHSNLIIGINVYADTRLCYEYPTIETRNTCYYGLASGEKWGDTVNNTPLPSEQQQKQGTTTTTTTITTTTKNTNFFHYNFLQILTFPSCLILKLETLSSA